MVSARFMVCFVMAESTVKVDGTTVGSDAPVCIPESSDL